MTTTATTPVIATFTNLSAEDVEAGREAISKLAARAIKAKIPGADTLAITVVAEREKKIVHQGLVLGTRTVFDVVVTGSIGLGGKVVAIATWSVDGVEYPEGLLTVLDDSVALPARARTCAHCGWSRDRNKTVFACLPDGMVAEYGATCLQAVCGISGTDAVGSVLTALTNIGESFSGTTGDYNLTIDAFVRATLAAITIEGFKSAGTARDFGGEATGSWAFRVLNGFINRKDKDEVADAKALLAAMDKVDAADVAAATSYCTAGGR